MVKQILLGLVTAFLIGCGGGGGATGGGGGGGGTGVSRGVTLNTYSANLAFNQTLNITATVPGVASQVITFTATGGSIAPTGASEATYTAPAVAGTFTITARSFSDPSKFATLIVTVSQVGITIQPESVTLGPGATTTFRATVTGSSNVGVTFTASGGTLTVVNSTTATYTAPAANGNYTVTARSNANPNLSATARVTVANVGANAIVTGRVVQEGTTTGINNVTVAFYNAAGSEVGRATTGADGRFNATVPVSARRFNLVPSLVPAAYYKLFQFGNLRFSATIITCSAALPTLTAGQTATLSNNIELTQTSSAPPPPPNGC